MGTGEVKGHILVSARAFCVERFGDTGWDEVRDALSPATRTMVEGATRGSWYELEAVEEVFETILRVLGKGNLDTMVEIGRFGAEHDLTTAMRLFMRVATPNWLLRGYAKIWGSYHTTGTWRIDSEGPHCLRGRLSGWGTTSEAMCVSLAGFVERFLQLVGGHNARVTRVQCRSRGDAVCEYLFEWDAAPSGGR